MPPFEIKGGIWLMAGILLKERNMADWAIAKLDADAAPNEGRPLADGVAPEIDVAPNCVANGGVFG